jgi:hypothetical protein
MFRKLSDRMTAKSAAVLVSLDTRLDRILQGWLLLAGLCCMARIAFSPHLPPGAALPAVTSYILVIVAPFASTLLALRWFREGDRFAQPATRLARLGRWRDAPRPEAEGHALYGTSGIMVSLLVGIMLNVPVRAIEYLTAMPPIAAHPPAWLSALHFMMTLDVVLFGSLYMIAFVAALRRVPLFPRVLAAIWLCDIAMQIATAQLVAAAPGLPDGVGAALSALLTGNVKKVLISIAVWLPYLLLSTRVNVTYRHRLPD